MYSKDLTPKSYNLQAGRRGAAMLSMVLVISTIVFLVTATGVLISTLQTNSAYNERLASEALFAARAGAQDAIVRIIRDKDYCASNPGTCSTSTPITNTITYTIEVSADRTADVSIKSTASGYEIASVGKALGRRKVMRAELAVDSISGEVKTLSFKEEYSL